MDIKMLLSARSVLLFAVLAVTVIAQSAERQFVNHPCRFSFRHPAAWEVVVDTTERDTSCSFIVRPRDLRQRLKASGGVDLFSVQIRAFPQGVWRQVTESGFERRARGWVIVGRMGAWASADSINGAGWSGLRGIAPAGCYRAGGGYVGTCDNPAAVLGTATRSISLTGGPQSEAVVDRIVATLRFDP